MEKQFALAITHKGFEEECLKEIIELIKADKTKCVIDETAVIFPIKNNSQLAELSYRSQSITKPILILSSFETNGKKGNYLLELIKSAVEKANFSEWLKNRTFRVNCSHLYDICATGMDIAEETGAYIIEKTKAKAKMSDPDIIVYVYITEKQGYIGIDFSGFDMSKRDYKIYSHPSSMNGSFAYCFLKACGYNKKLKILDPFCGSGIIPIEAALYTSETSPNFFRKDKFAFLKFMDIKLEQFDEKKENEEGESKIFCSDFLLTCVKATRNNSKIAGIDKLIQVTRAEIEWIDTKYEEKQFDLIITQPPIDSKQSDIKTVERAYKELFNHAEYVLKNNGRLAVILPKTECFRKCIYNFEIEKEFSAHQGRQEMFVVVMKKTTRV